MARTTRKYMVMPRRVRRHNPYGGNPMPGMMRTMAYTTAGIMGMGMMTAMGIGMMNAMKPS